MERIFPRQIDKKNISPDKLIRVEFSDIYCTVDSNGKRKRKPFATLINPMDAQRKKVISFYLSNAKDCGVIMGPQIDEATGDEIPGTYFIYSDGTYAWTSKTVYQFLNHDLILPNDFVEYIFSQEKKQ